jgi:cellulose synthase operon protein YhjQ
MGSRSTEIDDQSTVDSTPEDVAALYSWANLQGAKYRDYSASRREYRAQVRYRAAKDLLEHELAGQFEAEASAARAERATLAAQITPNLTNQDGPAARQITPLLSPGEAVRLASSERVEAARRAEAAARAGVLALREEREIAEAHSSALRQALVYKESELRRRQLAGPQPYRPLASIYAPTVPSQTDLRSDGPANLHQFLNAAWQSSTGNPIPALPEAGTHLQDESSAYLDLPSDTAEPEFGVDEVSAPAWLNSLQPIVRPPVAKAISQTFKGESSGGGTLQDSRERVASRWFALKGIFENAGPELAARQPLRSGNSTTPILAVFSLAGGVGKTSLVATLGRALSSNGEKVVLADTTSHGLLRIYFGSPQSGGAKVRGELTATECTDPPITLITHDLADKVEDDRHRVALTEEIFQADQGNHRLLLDLSTGSSWLIRGLVDLHPTVLVPIAPDMNSVISLQAMERLFRGFVDSDGRPLLPYYVLNQFDASLPLHLDVREVFRRQLGDRLLRFAIRRSPAVSEALADGMTVLDYSPKAPVSQDYRDIALWLRGVSPPATEESRPTRWGKQ